MSNLKDLPVSSQFKSFAKINWDLFVYPKSEDSDLHEIDSLVSTIDLFDEISLEISSGDSIEVFCDVAPGRKNIVWKAITTLFEFAKIKKRVVVKITKNIPHGAGLGGGSSNAMAVILELNKLLNLKISDFDVIKLSKEIGSDLPIFLNSGWMNVTSFGEKIEKLTFPEKKIVLFKPKESLSTKDVYMEFDKGNSEVVLPSLLNRYENPYNSLLKPAMKLLPIIEEIIKNLSSSGLFKTVSMTGSGSVVFAEPKDDIFPKREILEGFNSEFYLTKTTGF